MFITIFAFKKNGLKKAKNDENWQWKICDIIDMRVLEGVFENFSNIFISNFHQIFQFFFKIFRFSFSNDFCFELLHLSER